MHATFLTGHIPLPCSMLPQLHHHPQEEISVIHGSLPVLIPSFPTLPGHIHHPLLIGGSPLLVKVCIMHAPP